MAIISGAGAIIEDQAVPRAKTVSIGGAVAGELFARIENSDDVVAALRQRMADAGLAYATVEDLAGLAEGNVGKLVSAARVRALTINAFLRLAEVLGLRCLVIVDERLTRKMQPSWQKRDEKRVHPRRLAPLGRAQMKRVLPAVASELGKRGGMARMAALSAEQRSELGQRGARIRWENAAAKKGNAAMQPAAPP